VVLPGTFSDTSQKVPVTMSSHFTIVDKAAADTAMANGGDPSILKPLERKITEPTSQFLQGGEMTIAQKEIAHRSMDLHGRGKLSFEDVQSISRRTLYEKHTPATLQAIRDELDRADGKMDFSVS
jgi:hypothetical protein